MTKTQLLNLIAQHFDCVHGVHGAYADRHSPEGLSFEQLKADQLPRSAYQYVCIDIRMPHTNGNAAARLREILWDTIHSLLGSINPDIRKPKLYWRYDNQIEEYTEAHTARIFTRIAVPDANWETLQGETPYKYVGRR